MCELNDVAVGPGSLIEAKKHKYYGTKVTNFPEMHLTCNKFENVY